MRICFTGASGTGKSTLRDELNELLPQHTTFPSVQRLFAEHLSNFGTSEKTTDFTQTVILSTMAYMIIQNETFINDRCLICNFAYADVSENVKNADFLREQFEDLIKEYDIIYYTPIEFESESDGFRSDDAEFHKKVDDRIQHYIKKYRNDVDMVILTGTVEERMKTIISTLDQKEIATGKKLDWIF